MAKTLSRNRGSLFVLLVMIVGAVLALTLPIWIAPPHTSSTILLYSTLLVLWFPVLIVVFVMQRKRSKSRFFLLLVAGVLMTIVVVALAAPNVSVLLIAPKDCTSHEVSPGQTEYTCGIVDYQIITLQGPTGAPFAYLVSNKFVRTQ